MLAHQSLKGPATPPPHLPPSLTGWWLDRRTGARLPLLLCGTLLARGRRTVTSWFRACGITEEFRRACTAACAAGRQADHLAIAVAQAVRPLLTPCPRLAVAIGDTPAPRYGPYVEGCGAHHNPSPGPAGEKHVCGHVCVMLAALARHPDRGTIALPLQAQSYAREIGVGELPPSASAPPTPSRDWRHGNCAG